MRNLVLIFGDQLSRQLSALDDYDADTDCVWMAEVDEEITKVWSHKTKIAFFLSAMRHFRDELLSAGYQVEYQELTKDRRRDKHKSFSDLLDHSISHNRPARIVMTEPGDWFVREAIELVCRDHQVELEIRADRHFYCSISDFKQWAGNKKSLVLENFYRWMRKEHRILLSSNGDPTGGEWNYDKDNREAFGKSGPPKYKAVRSFQPDRLSKSVISLVNERYSDHPGSVDDFDYPVTAEQAREALEDFVQHRLPNYGKYQDAMWTDTTFLFHSRLSAVLNAHLLDPREAVETAIEAFRNDRAPIASVEGFVRQIIGWREFVRGIYWTQMPKYIERNALRCDDSVDVPSAFWDGQTEMNCIRQAMQPVLQYGYAHHIQRLMILGLFAQLMGVHPRKFHDWHMAMYVDAIDWVSLPNTLGMSQYGDGGIVGTKPYCASGNYVSRMSNYCGGCRFNPKNAVGDDACPMTTMYWDFLDRHRQLFSKNRRMVFQIKNLEKKSVEDITAIKERAEWVRSQEL